MKIIYNLLFIINYFINIFYYKNYLNFLSLKKRYVFKKVGNIFNVLIKVNRNIKKYLNLLTLILQENTIPYLF